MASLKNEIIDLIHKTIERKIFDETNTDISFNELGIDSIENMNIIFEIQEKYNLEKISDDEYDKLKTLTMIEEYINKVINS